MADCKAFSSARAASARSTARGFGSEDGGRATEDAAGDNGGALANQRENNDMIDLHSKGAGTHSIECLGSLT
ncbi:hypothetical protein [Hydrocarboniphaga sp.]|uniref:hypothetical protein n=1 Tax=Hydrocarboniphaga sp. TaxID=2033016 RepID=UPI003D0B5B2A